MIQKRKDLKREDYYTLINKGEKTEEKKYLFEDDVSFNAFLGDLEELNTHFAISGEEVISEEITLFNDNLQVAGTVDIITVDKYGNVKIYDMKTQRLKDPDHAGIRKPADIDDKTWGKSLRQKWTEQLNLYRILANNTHQILADSLTIIPITVDYPNEGQVEYTTQSAGLRRSKEGNIQLQPLVLLDNVKGAHLILNEEQKEEAKQEEQQETPGEGEYDAVTYTQEGKKKEIFRIEGKTITNSKGETVFAKKSADRNKIFANLAVKKGEALLIIDPKTDLKYVVVTEAGGVFYKKGTIISVKDGKMMRGKSEAGNRKRILGIAKQELDSKKERSEKKNFQTLEKDKTEGPFPRDPEVPADISIILNDEDGLYDVLQKEEGVVGERIKTYAEALKIGKEASKETVVKPEGDILSLNFTNQGKSLEIEIQGKNFPFLISFEAGSLFLKAKILAEQVIHKDKTVTYRTPANKPFLNENETKKALQYIPKELRGLINSWISARQDAKKKGVTDLSPIDYEAVQEQKVIDYISKSKEKVKEDTINVYYGANQAGDLSNFAPRRFVWGGHTWANVEAAFQAAKLEYTTGLGGYWGRVQEMKGGKPVGEPTSWEELNLAGQNRLKSLQDPEISGAEAKAIGKRLQGLDVKEWDKVSRPFMKEIVLASFEQNPKALETLLSTGDAILTHTQDKGKWGKEFPKILMEVRAELSKEKEEVIYKAQTKESGVSGTTTIQLSDDNSKKIVEGTKTTTIRKTLSKGGNIKVGETKIVNIGGKDFQVTNRGNLTIEEAGGIDAMLKSEGLTSIDDFMV